jgi:hypothetical protein
MATFIDQCQKNRRLGETTESFASKLTSDDALDAKYVQMF